MREELIREAVLRGGAVLVSEVPRGLKVTFNLHSFQAGDKFKGLKLVPEGFHLLVTQPPNEHIGASPACHLLHFDSGEPEGNFMCLRWDGEAEVLRGVGSDETVGFRRKFESFSLDGGLAPYMDPRECLDDPKTLKRGNPSHHLNWKDLSGFISPHTLRSVVKGGWERMSGGTPTQPTFPEHVNAASPPPASKQKEGPSPHIKGNKIFLDDPPPNAGDVVWHESLRFMGLPTEPFLPKGCSPPQVTQHSLDRTYVSFHLVRSARVQFKNLTGPRCLTEYPRIKVDLEVGLPKSGLGSYKEFLGELQLAFVMFLVGQDVSGLEAWLDYSLSICSSVSLFSFSTAFTIDFLQVFQNQLHHVSPDIFVGELKTENKLLEAVEGLCIFVEEATVPPSLECYTLISEILEYCTSTLGWAIDPLPPHSS